MLKALTEEKNNDSIKLHYMENGTEKKLYLALNSKQRTYSQCNTNK